MIKDFIISALIVYIFSTIQGWSIAGGYKLLVCGVLTVCLTLIIHEIEDILNIRRK